MGRLFDTDGRIVILAIDHAAFMGPMPGLERPGDLITTASQAGVDAVLTTFGVASKFGASLGRMGLILRMDGGATIRSTSPGDLRRLYSVQDALRLGADAVACMGMIGYPEEAGSLRVLTELAAGSAEWNIPLMAEMLVKAKGESPVTAADIGFAIRVGVELGAAFIKAPYAPPANEYSAAVQECYRPVVVLGGSKGKDEVAFLETIAEALQCGARGVAIGRNVWQHPNPAGMCRALTAIVHGGASVAQAAKEVSL